MGTIEHPPHPIMLVLTYEAFWVLILETLIWGLGPPGHRKHWIRHWSLSILLVTAAFWSIHRFG